MMNSNNVNINSENVRKLADVLKQLNSGENIKEARKNTLDLVKNIDPVELSLAEQKLIEEGMKPEDLRSLCSIHLEVLQDEVGKLKASVEAGHPLNTMIEEHDQILGFLTILDETNKTIQKRITYDPDAQEFDTLKRVAKLLTGAERHHLREEDALFPELEQRGITGPTRIMRMEHDYLRAQKRNIEVLSENVAEMDFEAFKKELNEAAGYVVFNLRDHIFKENHILYPSAFDAIRDGETWNEIKQKCDDIGYCSFTPSH